ncbi:hypothetical protein AAFF_G00234390 [Aldrovandia affinis]|uniref:Uncharacterized protein n=1 Tax=Aldrovandia affinis TaxID=143900 RepID=A0AAD7WTU5_9TELE|nr:hypothetical protein AAFF_G00234390 [Aldrovandia affinis]
MDPEPGAITAACHQPKGKGQRRSGLSAAPDRPHCEPRNSSGAGAEAAALHERCHLRLHQFGSETGGSQWAPATPCIGTGTRYRPIQSSADNVEPRQVGNSPAIDGRRINHYHTPLSLHNARNLPCLNKRAVDGSYSSITVNHYTP